MDLLMPAMRPVAQGGVRGALRPFPAPGSDPDWDQNKIESRKSSKSCGESLARAEELSAVAAVASGGTALDQHRGIDYHFHNDFMY
jgi:hypothetical protein